MNKKKSHSPPADFVLYSLFRTVSHRHPEWKKILGKGIYAKASDRLTWGNQAEQSAAVPLQEALLLLAHVQSRA